MNRLRLGRRLLELAVAAAVLVVGTWYVVAPTSTSGTSSTTLRGATTIRPERPQPYWTVLSQSRRGVMVEDRNVKVGNVVFRALRLRARTTLLRWHVGAGDPNAWRLAPIDAGPSIDWANEGPAGVVAAFNGAFKQVAKAGGAVVDHVVLEPMLRGYMTIALNRLGHWEMGVWGARNFPTPGFGAIALRQNLAPLVQNGRLTSSALTSNWRFWGDPINENPLTARTGLGVDAQGNLIYVATMTGVLAPTLARALISAGAVSAMQLDINPYWPILGASATPLHQSASFAMQLPGQEHSSSVFSSGWERDFFVALAEPGRWNCDWASPGVRPVAGVQPQPLRLVGRGCLG
ncbi:MAG TPA: phosphodiester glycosidase family protein [Acidimicrobiales bacterium]|nr:phosphodiester glycosidase family protein [Acidimicrobiales bacterium]